MPSDAQPHILVSILKVKKLDAKPSWAAVEEFMTCLSYGMSMAMSSLEEGVHVTKKRRVIDLTSDS